MVALAGTVCEWVKFMLYLHVEKRLLGDVLKTQVRSAQEVSSLAQPSVVHCCNAYWRNAYWRSGASLGRTLRGVSRLGWGRASSLGYPRDTQSEVLEVRPAWQSLEG